MVVSLESRFLIVAGQKSSAYAPRAGFLRATNRHCWWKCTMMYAMWQNAELTKGLHEWGIKILIPTGSPKNASLILWYDDPPSLNFSANSIKSRLKACSTIKIKFNIRCEIEINSLLGWWMRWETNPYFIKTTAAVWRWSGQRRSWTLREQPNKWRWQI